MSLKKIGFALVVFSSSLAVNLNAAPQMPSSFDVRNVISINPIKNQGQEPVVAYATVDAMEIALAFQKNEKTQLSEAFLFTCDTTDFPAPGFGGADMPTTFLTQTGFAAQSQFLTGSPAAKCATTPIFAKAVATGDAGTTTDEIKQNILKYGSVIATVDASQGDFTSYSGGVFNSCSTGTIDANHVITLIGWNDAGQYWIARNTWGTSWGDSGYIQIKYGCNGVGQETFFIDSGN